MPGNEFEGGIHKSFVLANSSQGPHLLQTGYGNQQVLDYDQYVLKQRQIGAILNELHDYGLKDSDSTRHKFVDSASLHLNQNYPSYIVTSDYTKFPSRNKPVNTHGLMLPCQTSRPCMIQPHFNDPHYEHISLKSVASSVNNLLQDTESCDSPTQTATSERSEVTEASTDFSFHQGQEQQLNRQQANFPQFFPMQQSGYNDMQLLQQHVMLKQLHDLQRQQQFSQFGDARQQSALNPFSAVNKHSGGLPLINGTPIQDAPQMFMNLMQGGPSSISPAFLNRLSCTQEQGPGQPSVGVVSSQPDPSLYGTPVASSRSGASQYSQLQGISNDAFNFLSKGGHIDQNSVNDYTIPANNGRVSQNAFRSSQGWQRKDMFETFDVQGLSTSSMSGDFDSSNTQVNAVSKDTTRQDQIGWPLIQQKTVQPGHLQGLVPLDPIEEKILYNMEEHPWEASFSRPPVSVNGSFGNVVESTDFSNSFPSVQSGSWSALMQSAVAEASSSDNGIQEEWSGMTYPNTEQSSYKQLSNFTDGHRQKKSWEDTKMQKASSSSSKPLSMFTASGTSSSFPGFQQQGFQFSTEHRENLSQEGSHGSFESKSPNISAEWVDRSTQRKTASNDDAGKAYGKPKGNASENKLKEEERDARSWKNDESHRIGFSSSLDAKQVQAEADYNLVNRETSQNTQNLASNNQPNYTEHIGMSTISGNEPFERKKQQIFGAKPSGGEDETCEDKQKSGHVLISGVRGIGVNDQGHSAEGNSASEEFSYKSGNNAVVPNGSNVTSPNSQNIELIHRFDHSREGTSLHFSSKDPRTSQSAVAETHRLPASIYNQSLASQGFSLRLSPPSQGMPNPNNFLSSQNQPQVMSYSNPVTANCEMIDKSQTWVVMPSLGGQLDGNRMLFGQSGGPFYVNTQGSSVAAVASRSLPFGNQPDMPQVSTVPVVSQTSRAALDNVPDTCTSQYSQHIPVDAFPASQPPVMTSIPLVCELSEIQNAWANEPNYKNPPSLESHITPSLLPSSAGPLHSSQGSLFSMGKESYQLGSASEMTPRLTLLSQGGDSQWDGFYANGKQGPIFSDQNSSPATGSSLPVTALQRNLQIAALGMSNHSTQESDSPPGQKFYEHHTTSEIPAGGRQAGATNMPSFLRGSGEDPGAKAFSQPTVENIALHETDRAGQSSNSNLAAPHASSGHIDPHVAPSWFKHFGTFRNGQIPPSGQLSFWKAPLNFDIHAPVEQVSIAESSQAGKMKSSAACPLQISPQLLVPSAFPHVSVQSISGTRSNKRKYMSSVSWDQEITQGSQRLQNISIQEQEWAQAANRLFEKVEDEIERLEDVRQMHQSKRRLILTTQLMQLLLHPAPQSILFAKANSNCESLLFFICRLTLGDACSLSHDLRSDFQLPLCNNEIFEKQRTSISSGHQRLSELLGEFMERAKRMETDFQRLDRTTSIVDVRVECQEIERFALINRFAKFHVRGQAQADTSSGASSASSSAQKQLPHKYVSALPLPRNLPQAAQCLSL